MSIKPGDASTFTCTVTNTSGTLVNTAVTGIVHLPDGTNAALTLSNPSTGVFVSQAYIWPQVGISTVRFTGVSPYPFVSELQVYVAPLDF